MWNKLLLLVLCFSCNSSLDQAIDPELLPYYQIFIDEGIKRGKDYSNVRIKLEFGKIGEKLGKAKPGSVKINREEFERDGFGFEEYNDYHRELTVIHELGHALLFRTHNNNCRSIMITGERCKYENYQLFRNEMLNELFK